MNEKKNGGKIDARKKSQHMTQQNRTVNRANAGAKVKQFQIHNKPALVDTDPFDEQMSVDKIQRKKKRITQNDDFER